MRKSLTLLFLLAVCLGKANANSPDTTSSLKFSAFADVYYSFDFNRPVTPDRPDFIYNHDRNNEFNLNLGYLKAAYSEGRVRANLAFGMGTYMIANYSQEDQGLQNLFEANAGFKLSETKNIWLDAGVLPSHIGFESAVSIQSATLTRSLVADNSPYYETGLRLSSTSSNGRWMFAALVLNGWQRIQKVNGSTTPSFGTQITYTTDRLTVNYSTFFGTVDPDRFRRWRIYHNGYMIYKMTSDFEMTLGFDFGAQQYRKNSNMYYVWFSPVFVGRYIISDKWSFSTRFEYFRDESEIVAAVAGTGLVMAGASVNVDHKIRENAMVRLEYRILGGDDRYFFGNNSAERTANYLTASICVLID